MTRAWTWSHRHIPTLRVDGRAGVLAALFAVVIATAVALRPTASAAGTSSAVEGATVSQQAAAGGAWALAETAVAAGLLGGILLWRRLPTWLQDALLAALKASVAVVAGAYAVAVNQFQVALVAVGGGIVGLHAIDEFDLYWVVNDLLALGVAIYIGVAAGIVLGPVVLAVGFVGLALYDYYFADRETWMFDLAAWTVRRRLPMLVVIPIGWRLDWAALAASFDSEGEDPLRFGVGTADLGLPAAFAVAVAHTGGGVPLLGAVAGILVACCRMSQKIADGGGAGLPPLATGALSGWGLALAVGVVA